MTNKTERIKKENLLQKIWNKAKTYIPVVLLSVQSTNVRAAGDADGKNENTPKKAVTETVSAYKGSYYNEICNGSPCWLASTYETRGAGQGRKINSAGTWNDNGGYRGINQMSELHARKYVKWLEGKPEFKNVYNMLKNSVSKANWQKTARAFEHEMILSQEGYLTEVYSPENFRLVQKRLDRKGAKISVKTLHPAVLSCMHQLMIENPSWYAKVADKMIEHVKKNKGNEKSLNSEEFIRTLVAGRHSDLVARASELLNNKNISWKEAQFAALVSRIEDNGRETKTWFEEQKKIEKDKRFRQRMKEDLKTKKITLAPQKSSYPTKINVKRNLAADSKTPKHEKKASQKLDEQLLAQIFDKQNKYR